VSGMLRPTLTALLAALAVLVGPATAALASGRDVINDCTDDEVLSKTYTQKEYHDALSQLAADADQYGNCRQVISRAQLRAAAHQKNDSGAKAAAPAAGRTGGGGGGGGTVGSAPARQQLADATPAERRAVDKARADGGRRPAVNNTRVDPSKVGTVPGVSRVSDLPTPLVAVLALLLVAALALAAVRIRSLVNARRA
jgi:hypothetical protein